MTSLADVGRRNRPLTRERLARPSVVERKSEQKLIKQQPPRPSPIINHYGDSLLLLCGHGDSISTRGGSENDNHGLVGKKISKRKFERTPGILGIYADAEIQGIELRNKWEKRQKRPWETGNVHRFSNESKYTNSKNYPKRSFIRNEIVTMCGHTRQKPRESRSINYHHIKVGKDKYSDSSIPKLLGYDVLTSNSDNVKQRYCKEAIQLNSEETSVANFSPNQMSQKETLPGRNADISDSLVMTTYTPDTISQSTVEIAKSAKHRRRMKKKVPKKITLVVPAKKVDQRLSPYVRYGVKIREKREDEIVQIDERRLAFEGSGATEVTHFHEQSHNLLEIDTLSRLDEDIHIGKLIIRNSSEIRQPEKISSLDTKVSKKKLPIRRQGEQKSTLNRGQN